MKNKTLNYLRTKASLIFFAIVCWFGFSIKVNSKSVRRSMYGYFNYHDWNYCTSITKVVVTENKNGLTILIETHRPGFLIGKGGSFINGLKDWIKEDLKRNDIEIDLNESKLWHNLYK